MIAQQALELPDWVPSLVKQIAEAMRRDGVGSTEVATRLLTNAKMKGTWSYLKRATCTEWKPGSNNDYIVLDSLRTHYLSELSAFEVLTPQDCGCATFFLGVVLEFSVSTPVILRGAARKSAEEWQSAGDLCHFVSRDPMFKEEYQRAAAVMTKFFEEHARMLREKGHFGGEQSAAYALTKSSGQRGDDKARTKARAVAMLARKIFASFLYGVVANVVSVAIDDDSGRITGANARDWCEDMHPANLPGD